MVPVMSCWKRNKKLPTKIQWVPMPTQLFLTSFLNRGFTVENKNNMNQNINEKQINK